MNILMDSCVKVESPKEMDFNEVSQKEISDVAEYRNNIPRKSLNYKTPVECFIEYVGKKFGKNILSRLN